MERDPRALAPYRQEFPAPFPVAAGGHYVRWAFGRVILDYIYWEEHLVVIVLGLKEVRVL